MKKLQNKKGFTLAELLIVVAIIAVLVAISVPIFTTQLEKSREAVDMSNIRAAYAEVVADYLTNGNKSVSTSVTAQQTKSGWQNTEFGTLDTRIDGVEGTVTVPAKTSTSGKTWTVQIGPNGASKATVEVK